jgi:hypothetical protein
MACGTTSCCGRREFPPGCEVSGQGGIELRVDVFNVFNLRNFSDPEPEQHDFGKITAQAPGRVAVFKRIPI